MRRAALLLAALACGPAHAEGQFAAGDPAAVAEAPNFMALTGRKAQVEAMVDRLRPMAIARLGSDTPFFKRAGLVEQYIMPDLRTAEPDLLKEITAVYAAQLSAEDMKGIEAFYATPAGQHLKQAQPAIDASVSGILFPWELKTIDAAIERHADELRAQGIDR